MFKRERTRVSPITGSRSEVFVDRDTGKKKIVNTIDVKQSVKYIKEKREAHGDKKTSFYNEKFRRGHRLVASIDPLVWVNHPEIWEDDEALKKFMDKYEYWKQLDVGFTYVKHKRSSMFSPSARKRVDEIFSE